MTPNEPKKRRERFYVEEAGKLLAKAWDIEDHERPDFIVIENGQKFGLEVCQIFEGAGDRKGSRLRKNEAEKQRAIDAHRQEYEEIENTPLVVKLAGNMCDENMKKVVPMLLEMNLSNKPIQYQENFTVEIEPWGPAPLQIYVTRAFRSRWYSIDDGVLWVDRDPIDSIDKAVQEKSEKLISYKQSSGLEDVRLLVVADRIKNSGKLALVEKTELNTRGFRIVYFFSYPESVETWDFMPHPTAAAN